MSLSRRGFLGISGAAAVSAVAGPVSADGASDPERSSTPSGTIIVLTLVGGLDGLALLVPSDDARYRELRPSIAIAPAGAPGGALPFVAGWGLHPALAPLLNVLPSPAPLAVVAGAGITDHWWSRSHRLALRTLHRGRFAGERSGWGTRLLEAAGLDASNALWVSKHQHAMFAELRGVMATARPSGRLDRYSVPSSARAAIAGAYEGDSGVALAGRAAIAELGGGTTIVGSPIERGYPDTALGTDLATIAEALHAGLDLRLVAIDHHGYDTHRGQGDGVGGVLANRIDDLSRSLAAFWLDLDSRRDCVTVVCVTEMGRTVFENRRAGTNHGTGSCAVVIDPTVVGGLHGLPGPIDPGADFGGWPTGIDVHQVLADVAERRGFDPFGVGILPTASADGRLGLFV